MSVLSDDTLQSIFDALRLETNYLRRWGPQVATQMATQDVSSAVVLRVVQRLKESIDKFTLQLGNADLQQFVRDLRGNQSIDLDNVITGIVALTQVPITTVYSTYPVSADGFLKEKTLDPDGTVSTRSFTPGSIAQFRIDLHALSTL